MKTNGFKFVRNAVLQLSLAFCIASALAHDGEGPNMMPPVKATYEFGPMPAAGLKSSSIMVETEGRSQGECRLLAMTITQNGSSIKVPASLLSELGTVDISTLEFYSYGKSPDTYIDIRFRLPLRSVNYTGMHTFYIHDGRLEKVETNTSSHGKSRTVVHKVEA